MLSCGIDIGSTTIEVVLHDGERVLGMKKAVSGAFPAEYARKAYQGLLGELALGEADVDRIVTTGFGRNYFDGAHKVVSEISCHAAGVRAEIPGARTIIEIGGQDSKMIRLNERGLVTDFVMNDRCAAGTGRFIETVSRILNLSIEETGSLGLGIETASEISSMCAVFAESEIVGLLHQGRTPASLVRGVCNSVARRILGMSGRIGLEEAIVFTGGVAKNPGVLRSLEEITGRPIRTPREPEFTGALGAALLASRIGFGNDKEKSIVTEEAG